MVIAVARKYVGQGLDFADLVQEGNLGLFRAVDKFNHTLGYWSLEFPDLIVGLG